MKIACWYPENMTAAWNCTCGVAEELQRMGHEVSRIRILQRRTELPDLLLCKSFDMHLLLGVEHYYGLLNGAYGDSWQKKVNVPKIAWPHESAFREDRNHINKEVLTYADEWFFPAAQDAEFFDQEHFVGGRSHWLPFGVDIEIFRLTNPPTEKKYPCAFIGLLYPKRQQFLAKLARSLDDKLTLDCGNVAVQDLSGSLMSEATKLYAKNLRQIEVFVNLPALSQHQVTKVFEVMACGTFLITPAIEGAGAANMQLFKKNVHCVYYPESRPDYLAQLMKDWTSPDKLAEREKIARAGFEEIRTKHTLRHRLEELLATVKIKEEKAVSA